MAFNFDDPYVRMFGKTADEINSGPDNSLWTKIGNWFNDTFVGSRQANITNAAVARENMALTRETNAANLAFQKQENDITREREDNAVRRAALDMQASGLSKTLAAGSPASASALSPATMVAPQNNYVAQKAANGAAILSVFNSLADLSMKKAEISNVKAQTAGINLDNGFKLENHVADMRLKESHAKANESLERLNYYNSEIARITSTKTADKIDAEIRESISRYNVNWSTIALNDKRKEEVAQNILESVARTNKLDAETKNVVRQAILQRIDIVTRLHNFMPYYQMGLPEGYSPSGVTKPFFDLGFLTQGLGNIFARNVNKFTKGAISLGSYGPINLDLTGF